MLRFGPLTSKMRAGIIQSFAILENHPYKPVFMQIKVNGEWREVGAPVSLQGLAEALNLNKTQVAIERNRQIVPRSTYGSVMLDEGDELEIVQFIGGG